MTSLTIENYIKTVYQICARSERHLATTGALAEALNVSPGTVTSMLKTLSEAGWVVYTPYEGVSLTDAGRQLALRVLRRHRLIELFLARTLDLSWDEVHDEAEHLEHAVSDFLVDRIDRYLGFPTTDPHGDPIPKADGSLDAMQGCPLDDWAIRRPFQLIRVLDQSPEFLRYLSETGLQLGAEGHVVSSSPQAGLMTIHVGQRDIPLTCMTARKLLVVEPQSHSH